MDAQGWQFWIDRGGTFTDIIARAPDGRLKTLKLLSVDSVRYRDAASEGIRRILAGQNATLPGGETTGADADRSCPQRISAIRMGTTVATNALLERKGDPVVLVTTAGLGDVLRIGTQNRPDIFALDIRLPQMLYGSVIEAAERMSAHGEVITGLDEDVLHSELKAAYATGIRSVAIAFLHGYRYPDHERRAADIARDIGFEQVSVSHQVSPLMKLVPRGHTTLVDAYLSPVLDRYIRDLREGLADLPGNASLLFMQSHGGLVRAEAFRGKDSLLSGPAAGVVGMAAAAESAGFREVIGFDMGGTSTDVSLYRGEFERTGDSLVAGVRVNAPMMRIHTVAAGGGSILKFDAGRLQAGPESAGAWPGPACYRNGGPLTVTDANLLLGRIQADHFPQVFGPHGDAPLDRDAVMTAFDDLAAEVTAASDDIWSAQTLAAGFLRIAVEKMANAIKTISVQRGHDVTRFALVCFGGAGGQHACQVADALGIRSILLHPMAGVLSAYGMGIADLRCLRQRTVEEALDVAWLSNCTERFAPLEDDAVAELSARDAPTAEITFLRRLKLKRGDADTALAVDWSPTRGMDDLLTTFSAAHRQHFGFDSGEAQLIVESIEVEAIAVMARPQEQARPVREYAPTATEFRDIWFDGASQHTPVFNRVHLQPGATLTGPALVVESNATTVVEPGWRASVNAYGHMIVNRDRPVTDREQLDTACDPVMLEVFNNLFMHIAEQMGAVLENTAWSVNIKERLDFSCAIFDARGDLVANAPHVPVHLGSMGDSVQSILRANAGEMRPGDVYLMNAPYSGGTHLPDVTVVTPVFDDHGQLLFTVACRAHHADIGGISPGSMPAQSTSIEQEGVLFENLLVVRGGVFAERELRERLAAGRFPARNPDQNIADLKAQIAANARGVRELERMMERFGLPVVHAYMQHIQDNAEQCVRRAIARLSDGRFELDMDGGEHIATSIRTDPTHGTAVIDFTGTGPPSARNFNAPASIARAAVLYVFRSLIRESIPLNAGCLKPLKIILPANSLVDPRWPAAVVAGNVETSQCITDALLAALSACAASQGTMNNLTFGNAEHQYYETLCGGAGAGPDFDGASAVHTHMTNSRLTDPEVLEWRYPVRLTHFGIRHGSGGQGRHVGGNGVTREIEFLVAMQAAVLSNRRLTVPFGLEGGEPGQPGSNRLLRSSGEEIELGATAELELTPGDRLRISTPGGGGFGSVTG